MLKKLLNVTILFSIIITSHIAFAQKINTAQKVIMLERGTKIILHGNSNDAVAYQWYKNLIQLPGEIAKDIIVKEEGLFSVVAFNRDGCPSEMSDNIKVVFSENKSADLSIDFQTPTEQAISNQWATYQLVAINNSVTDAEDIVVTLKISGKFQYQADSNTDMISYDDKSQIITWTLTKLKTADRKSLKLNIKGTQPGKIDFIAEIKGAQTDPNSSNNIRRSSQEIKSLVIPNVFTPNGDGVNDTFIIPGLESFAESEITIANRAGISVFTRKNYRNDWAGENLPEGTYFYLLKIKDSNGSWQVYKSYITLLRSKL